MTKPRSAHKPLSFDDAIEAWKARWQRKYVRHICAQYDVDPRRLYEVWTEETHVGSREIAFQQLKAEDPTIAARIDPSPHVPTRRVFNRSSDGQLSLFSER